MTVKDAEEKFYTVYSSIGLVMSIAMSVPITRFITHDKFVYFTLRKNSEFHIQETKF